MRKHGRYGTSALLLCLTMGSSGTGLAGDLEPPGPPAPTMKTLAEAEPRIPIHAADLPLTIDAAGSYYLAEDIATDGGGITISTHTENVTIDLMGFTLAGGTGFGIAAGNPTKNIVVRNGTVSGWERTGVFLSSAANSMVIDVTAKGNGEYGIQVGDQGRVFNSVAVENGNIGLWGATNSLIQGCIANRNGSHGIQASSGSYVLRNLASGNGTGGNPASAGINVSVIDLTDVRIEGNTVIGNPIGISATASTGHLIIGNAATGNGNDYNIVAGNDVGPIGDAATSTSPWANIQF